ECGDRTKTRPRGLSSENPALYLICAERFSTSRSGRDRQISCVAHRWFRTVESRVQSLAGDQGFMVALFADPPVFEDVNAIGMFDRAQTVSDDDRGAIIQEFVQTFVQAGFGLVVDGRGCFV